MGHGHGNHPEVPLPWRPTGSGLQRWRPGWFCGEGYQRCGHDWRAVRPDHGLLDDEVADPRFSKSTALALETQGRAAEPAEPPIAVTWATIPGYAGKFATLTSDGQDGFGS